MGVQKLHPLWLNWWKVSSPYTARDGSVTHFGAISEYMYCIVDGLLAHKTNNPYLYHVMSPGSNVCSKVKQIVSKSSSAGLFG